MNLENIGLKITKILEEELGMNDAHFVLCIAKPIEKAPHEKIYLGDPHPNYAVNYVSSDIDYFGILGILSGISELIKIEKGMVG